MAGLTRGSLMKSPTACIRPSSSRNSESCRLQSVEVMEALVELWEMIVLIRSFSVVSMP